MTSIVDRKGRADLLRVAVGTGAGLVGAFLGTRLLTETASTAAFGEVKVALSFGALAASIATRPFVQFVAREYHDVQTAGADVSFLRYAVRGVWGIGWKQALVVMTVLLLASRLGYGVSPWVAVAAAVLCIPESLLALLSGLAITRNQQNLASVLELLRQCAVPVFVAACLRFIHGGPVMFLGAQALIAFSIAGVGLAQMRLLPARTERTQIEPPNQWRTGATAFAIPLIASATEP